VVKEGREHLNNLLEAEVNSSFLVVLLSFFVILLGASGNLVCPSELWAGSGLVPSGVLFFALINQDLSQNIAQYFQSFVTMDS
jgi:hypothetical protein